MSKADLLSRSAPAAFMATGREEGPRLLREAALHGRHHPHRVAMLRANVRSGQILPPASWAVAEVGEDVVRVALAIVGLGGEDLDRLLDEATVRVRDDRHAPGPQHAIHLRKHRARVGQVLHAQRHGDEVETVVLPWQPCVVVEVLHVALRRDGVDVQLRLVEAVDGNPRALEELRREVGDPRGAEVQHREAAGHGGEGAAVERREALQGGGVEMVHEAGLRVHRRVDGLVDPREVVIGVRPCRRGPAVLRVQRHAHRCIRVALRQPHLLPAGPGDGHPDEARLLEHPLEHALPLLDRPVPADVEAVARDVLAQQEVGHLPDGAAQVVVHRLHASPARVVREPLSRLARREAGLLRGSGEDGGVGDVLGLFEVTAGERLDHLVLPPKLLGGVDEDEGVEGVHHAAVGVELHPGLEPGHTERVRLGVRELLGVAVLTQEVVVEALALLWHIRVQEDGAVPQRGALAEAEVLHRLLQVQKAEEGKRAAHVRQHVNDDGRARRRGPCRSPGRHREPLRELLEALRVRELHPRLRGSHELAEGGEALSHGDVEVAGVHHGVPAPAHGDILTASGRLAHRVPGNIPEVAEVEPRDAGRPGADHGVAASVDHAARVDLREGAHLQQHRVRRRRDLADVPRRGHHEEAGALRLLDGLGGGLVGVSLLVKNGDEVGVDVPRQPVLACFHRVVGRGGGRLGQRL
mmetsp:Transcript_95353/g.267049  ORF Transcript_95353/g.267049 Transcript_95353/m.267049 type:complete len:695 (-) Transcript_95353:206-2290(-)